MKLAYVTTHEGQDIRNWSGIPYHIAQALQSQSISLEYVGSLREKHALLLKAKKYIYRAMTGQKYLCDRDPIALKDYARQVAARLPSLNPDVVFSPGTLPIAYLKCRQPIAFWTDATFAAMLNFYPGFTNLHKKTIADGMAMEKAALDGASLAIYSSDWAAHSAIHHYGADPAKVTVIPFGANIECHRTEEEIRSIVDARATDRCNLLFLAVDWNRKRGSLAVEVGERLNAGGLPTEVTIVGCHPPTGISLPAFVRCLGFISKSRPEGQETITALLCTSHFLILPSLADCTPIVFSEANSFGMPCLSTNVGGIPSVIRDEINGKMFNLADGAECYARYIRSVMSEHGRYQSLALSSFHEYQTRLNWRVGAEKVKKFLIEIIQPSSSKHR